VIASVALVFCACCKRSLLLREPLRDQLVSAAGLPAVAAAVLVLASSFARVLLRIDWKAHDSESVQEDISQPRAKKNEFTGCGSRA
jgi:hypothetical protein